jgi:hypothetical protein
VTLRDWETQLRTWAKAPGTVEQAKMETAEKEIRAAISGYPALAARNIKVFPQGSYRNRTNIPTESDVDICVVLKDVIFSDWTFTEGQSWKTPDQVAAFWREAGLSEAAYQYAEFKNDVGGALVTHFGASAVKRGDKAFDRTAAQFQQSTRVVASCPRRQPLTWWLTTVVRPLRFLLSLATEDPTFVERIRLRRRPGTDDDVEVVWANDLGSGQPERARNQLLFWQSDVGDRFESAMVDWFSAVAAVGHVLSQYVATLNTQRSYAETRFVMTAQAAEAYHRERLASFHTTRQRSPDAWLVNRLVGLCQSVPDVTQLVVGDDARTFAESVRDARNLRTHLNADRDDHMQLVPLGAQLGVILEGAILHRELGFPSPLIAERIAANSRLKALADAARARDVPTSE